MKNTIHQCSIGLYHPQLMNRVAISCLLNTKLSNRVKAVGHLFDLFSSNYSIVILIEPETPSVKYNPVLIETFTTGVSKPVIIVPFYSITLNNSTPNVVFTKKNPKAKELVECIMRTENDFLLHLLENNPILNKMG